MKNEEEKSKANHLRNTAKENIKRREVKKKAQKKEN